MPAEGVAARHEGGVAHGMRGGDEAADVHACATSEIDAARVDEIHLARGVDPTKDLAGIRIQHAVEGDGLRVGLVEVDRGRLADVERAPIDGGTLAGLIDVEHRIGARTGLTQRGRTGAHHATRGQGVRGGRISGRGQGAADRQQGGGGQQRGQAGLGGRGPAASRGRGSMGVALGSMESFAHFS